MNESIFVKLSFTSVMRRESDKYHFKEPFGREIRKKMIDSQKKAMQGPERFMKLGQLKPSHLATVGHVATGLMQVEKKQSLPTKVEKKPKEKKGKKAKKQKRKKSKRNHDSDAESKEPVEKKAKKGDSKPNPKKPPKNISNISLAEFDEIRKHFPGKTKNVSEFLA